MSAETEADRLRDAAEDALTGGEWGLAAALLQRLFRQSPTLATAQYVLSRGARMGLPRTPYRLFIARSFTVEPAVPLLRAGALLHGMDLEVEVGAFGAYAQELIDPSSALHASAAQVVLLAVQTRDLLPGLWNRFPEMRPTEVDAELDRTLEDLRAWISAFRARSQAHLIVQNFELPGRPLSGLLDVQAERGQAEAIRELNRRLAGLAREQPGVFVLDYDGLVGRFGRDGWHDERKWLTARMPIAAGRLPDLAEEYLRHLLPLAGRTAKVLAVDLDNTLWSGVVGEDGPSGIRLDGDYPGSAHLTLQRAILALRARGLILAIASKNNEADALEVLEGHPAMLLRPHHFAARRIDWNDKAESLRALAGELNVGLDSLAFLDDNPAERDRVRTALPEVTVVELPEDPMGYARALLDCPIFERLDSSPEDRDRGRLYSEQRQRASRRRESGTLEDYLGSLDTEMDMEEAAADELARVAQLTQKTNQFNTTTRRYSEQEIVSLATDQSAHVYRARVRDRFGDSGLVGVVITRELGEVEEIDSFLLSCRVIGRRVESAMLSWLAGSVRARGARRLQGSFLPTTKNGPAADLFASHGFQRLGTLDDGSVWELDLAAGGPPWPSCIAPAGRLVGAGRGRAPA